MRTDARQLAFMARENCDVWLLTEVSDTFEMAPGTTSFSETMGPGKAWSAIWARNGLDELPSIHETVALATVGDVRFLQLRAPLTRGAVAGMAR
jgi:hypothetical protein